MSILEHTIKWYKGEIIESIFMGGFGVCFILLSLVFLSLGKTPNAQALTIPLAGIGVLFIIASVFLVSRNIKTLQRLKTAEIENQRSYALLEKQRVEHFQSIYTYTKIGAGILFGVALGLFFIPPTRYGQAIGIAFIVIGLSGLVIDYFSKERADMYYKELLKITK